MSVNKQHKFIAHKISLTGESKSYVNPLPQEKMLKTTAGSNFFRLTWAAALSSWPRATHYCFFIAERRTTGRYSLFTQPGSQLKNSWSFAEPLKIRAILRGGSMRTTAPYYPQGKIDNSQQQYGADGSDRQSSPRTGVAFQ